MATIIYAIFGIPLMISVLNDLGDALLTIVKRVSSVFGAAFSALWECIKTCWCYILADHVPTDYRPSITHFSIVSTGEQAILSMPMQSDTENREMDKKPEQSTPLLPAAFVSISWLFVCAAIFTLWEEWTYFESFYFFFISLSTIGFGDLSPQYPKFTILTFPLVLIGLALLGVCFNLVNEALEKLYMSILQSMLKEIQQMQNNVDGGMTETKSASTAFVTKYLMPLMSKSKKENLMTKFKEDAHAAGITLPPALTKLDPSTGLPAILAVATQKSDNVKADTNPLKEWIAEQNVKVLENLGAHSVLCQTEQNLDNFADTAVGNDEEIHSLKSMQIQCETLSMKSLEAQTSMAIEVPVTKVSAACQAVCNYKVKSTQYLFVPMVCEASSNTLPLEMAEKSIQTDSELLQKVETPDDPGSIHSSIPEHHIDIICPTEDKSVQAELLSDGPSIAGGGGQGSKPALQTVEIGVQTGILARIQHLQPAVAVKKRAPPKPFSISRAGPSVALAAESLARKSRSPSPVLSRSRRGSFREKSHSKDRDA